MRPFDVLELEIFGESHSPEIGARLAGLPAGESFDPEEVARFAARRKSGKYLFSTPRREEDECVFGGCAENADGTLSTTDAPLTARILNTNIAPPVPLTRTTAPTSKTAKERRARAADAFRAG